MNPVDTVKDTYSAIEAKDWKKVDNLVADDFAFIGPVEGQVGKKEFIELHRSLLSAIPDFKFNPSNYKEAGGRVTTSIQITGTHTAPLSLPMLGIQSFAATNKKIRMPQEPLTLTVRDNRLSRVEVSSVAGGGVSGLLAQLGIVNPIDLVKNFFSAIEAKDWKRLDNLITDDLVFSGAVPPQYGKKEFVNLHRALLTAIPDWKFNATNYHYDGKHVTCIVQLTGTQSETLDYPTMDIHSALATNKKFKLPQETLTYTLQDNRICKVEVSSVPGGGLDGILSQLGVRVVQHAGSLW